MPEILGCSDGASIGEYPEGLKSLISLYIEEYNILQSVESEDSDMIIHLSSAAPEISPLLKTRWGQNSPFNDKCPRGCPSGCVATAMAQIMNYYEYPDMGLGYFSYTSRSRMLKLSYDFGANSFSWSDMADYYSTFTNESQKEAVSNLLFACGVSVSMDYNNNGSGAYDIDVPFALINYFNYNDNTICLQRDYYDSEEWFSRLYTELKEGRPVLYCGADSKQGGHAFVVDGCRSSDNKVHVNWGWDGNFLEP